MKDFWDKRYSEKNFAYGKEPNKFFDLELRKLEPAKLLLPGEGEGRNAVSAAKLGWDVTALDYSISAKEKADKFAKETDVKINYIVTDLLEYQFPEDYFDAAALIFLHLDEDSREKLHELIIKSLKPGGVLIGEFFSKEQLKLNSGGPKNIDMLYSLEQIYTDFHTLDLEIFSRETPLLDEGDFHNGKAETIRIVGKKEIST
ncbi:MAG: methyltransferase [Melioribacteraceae bacterium]|nr:MAG: methyltransferase [Melioribacteraceae bacterium]